MGHVCRSTLGESEHIANGKVSPFVSVPFPAELENFLGHYEFNRALDFIWRKIEMCDQFIQKTKPFTLVKTDPTQAKADIEHLVGELWQIANWLEPFMPATAEKIKTLVHANRPPDSSMFPRK